MDDGLDENSWDMHDHTWEYGEQEQHEDELDEQDYPDPAFGQIPEDPMVTARRTMYQDAVVRNVISPVLIICTVVL